jgi:hypothetical protein
MRRLLVYEERHHDRIFGNVKYSQTTICECNDGGLANIVIRRLGGERIWDRRKKRLSNVHLGK